MDGCIGRFACVWALFHYLSKWALYVIIKCSSAVENANEWDKQSNKPRLVPYGHAKPGSDLEATKETVLIVIADEEHFIFFCLNIIYGFTLFCTQRAFGISALVKHKIKSFCSADRLSNV